MQTPLYFAYGSNMLQSRIQRRVGRVKNIGTHKLSGHKLVFGAPGMFCSYSNIRRQYGACVHGVLYELNQIQQAELDQYEGYPRQYKKLYDTLPDGRIFYAYVYDGPSSKQKPTLDYLNLMIEGAIENDLKIPLRQLLKYKSENYALKKGNKHESIYKRLEEPQEDNSGDQTTDETIRSLSIALRNRAFEKRAFPNKR